MSKIEILDVARFDEVYDIMEKSFPFDEVRPREGQRKLLSNPVYRVYTFSEDDKILALAATWHFDDLLFLEHLATAPDARGRGIGSQMLSYLANNGEKTLCLEVEPPESELTRRRIAFYERNGFCLNHYPYAQPSIAKGRAPVPLMIMTYGNKIDKSKFEQIRDRLYTEVYKTDKVDWSI